MDGFDLKAAAERVVSLHESRRDGLWAFQAVQVARAFLEVLEERDERLIEESLGDPNW